MPEFCCLFTDISFPYWKKSILKATQSKENERKFDIQESQIAIEWKK